MPCFVLVLTVVFCVMRELQHPSSIHELFPAFFLQSDYHLCSFICVPFLGEDDNEDYVHMGKIDVRLLASLRSGVQQLHQLVLAD